MAEIKKQIEYYLGDKNLSMDDFFRGKISEAKSGYIDIKIMLNCNKIKSMGVTVDEIAEACKSSSEVEVSKDKKMIRRMKNKELPPKTGSLKKRDSKVSAKQEESKTDGGSPDKVANLEDEAVVVQRDEQGRILFVPQDFDMENTLIINFKTNDQDKEKDEDYKITWKEIEKLVKANFDKVKVTYSRSDKYEGQLAISTFKASRKQIEELASLKDQEIGEKKFQFSRLEGEDLKDFWQKQGSHFHHCIAPKMRLAKKNNRKSQDQKREEKAKRQKKSYEIAGVYYMDINKVKSKSRAILNNMKDGDKLNEADTDFIRFILKCHSKAEEKEKDFDGFVVGPHPEYNKTRCFFVLKKDGSKEDFSVSKCISNLENLSAS